MFVTRWLPVHCAEHEVVALCQEDYPDVDKTKGKQFNRRFLDLSVWMMAWDRYAIGATLLQQMSFVDAQNHKAVVIFASPVRCCGTRRFFCCKDNIPGCVRHALSQFGSLFFDTKG